MLSLYLEYSALTMSLQLSPWVQFVDLLRARRSGSLIGFEACLLFGPYDKVTQSPLDWILDGRLSQVLHRNVRQYQMQNICTALVIDGDRY